MTFDNVQGIVDAQVAGQSTWSAFRKVPSQVTVAGNWFDLSLSAGNPKPQYYAASPLIGQPMSYTSDGGLFHGAAGNTSDKYLRTFCVTANAATGLPLAGVVLDYLYFYPFAADDTTDAQLFDNTAPLPRYVDGEGVQIMVVSVGARVGGQQFTMSYTNSDGVSGRTTGVLTQNAVAAQGSIVTSQAKAAGNTGWAVPLQAGDTGVRSVESLTMLGADSGLMAVVLVKPVAQFSIFEITAPVEYDYLRDWGLMPPVADDAYLNMIVHPNGSLSGTNINGYIETVWS